MVGLNVASVPVQDVNKLMEVGKRIRDKIMDTPFQAARPALGELLSEYSADGGKEEE